MIARAKSDETWVYAKSDETWVYAKSGAALCALTSGERGMLMHLPEPRASGATSRDPKYTGPKDATLRFRLANGQVDVYPTRWTLPRATIEKALAHFRETGQRPTFITWHQD